ncbi:hypothetical protein Pma05_56750 [Plantactinospora mayteni]|uniref:Uncharacterized protein n=1 Tax=Plantactinospora mayteni TaxID=566021 RepID=A0ABQ4EWW7_9ACTN|nr:hypothetical protein Pma05_56750 [Plantactinospora mayteni]
MAQGHRALVVGDRPGEPVRLDQPVAPDRQLTGYENRAFAGNWTVTPSATCSA